MRGIKFNAGKFKQNFLSSQELQKFRVSTVPHPQNLMNSFSRNEKRENISKEKENEFVFHVPLFFTGHLLVFGGVRYSTKLM